MEIKRHERGRYRGRIDWLRSFDTMERGEEYLIPETDAALQTIRNAVSVASKVSDKVFSSQCAGLTFPFIKVTRIR